MNEAESKQNLLLIKPSTLSRVLSNQVSRVASNRLKAWSKEIRELNKLFTQISTV